MLVSSAALLLPLLLLRAHHRCSCLLGGLHQLSHNVSGAASREEDGGIRVAKLLSDRNVCSRAEAEHFLQQGWVAVNGKTADSWRVNASDEVTLAPAATDYLRSQVTAILNKPAGWVSSQPEADKLPAIQLITADRQRHRQAAGEPRVLFDPATHLPGLVAAGRLDLESRGLLVFTQSGRIRQLLISGKGDTVTKEYVVHVNKPVDSQHIDRLSSGSISLDGKPVMPCLVTKAGRTELVFRLQEGRNRQIRRMCGAVGLEVVDLLRTRIGNVRLDVDEGCWRFLHSTEGFGQS